MTDKVYNVLILLCTGNSARSILGEALINDKPRPSCGPAFVIASIKPAQ